MHSHPILTKTCTALNLISIPSQMQDLGKRMRGPNYTLRAEDELQDVERADW